MGGGIGYAVGSFPGGQQATNGFMFTAQSTGAVASLDAIVFSNNPGNMMFSLYTDNSGIVGSLLETITMDVPDTNSANVILNASAIGSTILTSGEQYWLVATGDGTTNSYSWIFNTQGDTGPRVFGTTTLSYDTQLLGAFRITTVPIPPALYLFGSGLLGLIGISSRKKTAQQS